MTWIAVIALALAAFAFAAFALRLERQTWTALLAALALGLAGYATQASPGLPGAPKDPRAQGRQSEWPMIDERKAYVAESSRSTSDRLLVADALARRGQYANAAAMLNGAVRANPNDAEAWLALAIVLAEHADGALTEPATYAFRRAAAADPQGLGPGYFLGVALMRQGRFGEGREAWRATLEQAPADAEGRARMEAKLAGLDALLRQILQQRQQEQGALPPVQK